MIPVISIVSNKSNMGKTTVICKIIGELKSRGYRVATIKHHWGDFNIDYPGKDSWKHREAGADTVVVSSPTKMAIIEKVKEAYKLDNIIEKIENVDIIITEGYKDENKPKIEIIRKGISEAIISRQDELFAIVTDFSLEVKVPQFEFNQLDELVNLIEEEFLK